MARLSQVVIPGLPHHITQRGNRRQQTFFNDGDYAEYLALMGHWCEELGVEIWCYCLMPNHVHRIAVPKTEDGLRRAIGEAHRRYSWRVNFREDWRRRTAVKSCLLAAIVICAVASVPTLCQTQVMNRQYPTNCEFYRISCAMDRIQDTEILAAIRKSQETFPEFRRAFDNRRRAQQGFMVTILADDGDSYSPVGILVEEMGNLTIAGRRVANGRLCEPGEMTSCCQDAVVDWRYIDAFEMVGGALYRELYSRQHLRVQRTIASRLPFLICRKREIPPDLLQLYRGIANGRTDRIEHLPTNEISMSGLTADMPMLTRTGGRSVELYSWSIPEYGAQFGSREVIDVLFKRGVLIEESGKYSPLAASTFEGNLEATTRLLQLGFDPNALDELDNSPLLLAARLDHVEIGRRLIAHGADCDYRDRGTETPLFYVVSEDFARLLIEAGADVHAVNDIGRSCVQSHFEKRRLSIVKLLVNAGAELDVAFEDMCEADLDNGCDLLMDLLDQGHFAEAASEIRIAASVGFGYVLPVHDLPKRGTGVGPGGPG